MQNPPIIIAVCGKGGVGKTSISALIVRMFTEDRSKKVLAIDADPAVGLSYALGLSVTRTVDQIRMDQIRKLADKTALDKDDMIRHLEYDLFSALCERENLAFLAIGRPEGDGCYCRVNRLLRQLIKDIADQFDIVVIDGEAGLEQINRRVMEQVTHMLIVSDGSLKGRKVAETIDRVGKNLCSGALCGIIFNRLRIFAEEKDLNEKTPLPVVHMMYENDRIRQLDRQGRPLFDLQWSDDLKKLEGAIQRFVAERSVAKFTIPPPV